METTQAQKKLHVSAGFKSYYVVWKLFRGGRSQIKRYLFKSYYVVWKPDRKGGRIMFYSGFKSYYVVWKPRDHRCFECA